MSQSRVPTTTPSGKGPGLGAASGQIAVLTGVLSILACAGCYVAALPWLRGYQVNAAAGLLAVAAFLPLGVSAAFTRVLRFQALVALGISVTALVLVLWTVSNFNFSQVWDGVARVPAELLTETLPLGGSAYLLCAPIVLTWACAFLCAEGLLRSGAPRSLPLAAPPAYFALSFAATTSAPLGPTASEAAALVGIVAGAAMARHAILELSRAHSGPLTSPSSDAPGKERFREHDWKLAGWHRTGFHDNTHDRWRATRHTSVRRAVGGALGCGVVVAALALSLPHVGPLSSRPVAVSRPTKSLDSTIVEPVDVLAALRTSHLWGRPLEMFQMAVNGPWSGYVPVAVMSTYDGGAWSFTPVFRPTGGRVPAAGPLPGRLVRQSYKLDRPLPLPLLPALERPIEVSGTTVDADIASGMLASAGPPAATYHVTSRTPGVTASQLPATTLFTGAALTSAGELPGGEGAQLTQLPPGSQRFVAPAVHYAVDLTGQPATPTLAFLQALSASLRASEKWAVPPRAPGSSLPAALTGVSLAQVMNAVTVDRAATPEQFATFVAVVGRELGVPVRLVSGFRVAGATSQAQLPAGRYAVMAADAWTWDEVPVVGEGWVVLDPTPQATTTNTSAPPEQVTPAKPHKPKPATAVPNQPASHAVAHRVKVDAAGHSHVNWALALGAGLPVAVVIALATLLLGIPGARRRLRRLARQRGDEPALLAVGAWLELVDNLCRLGLEVAPSATSREVAKAVGDQFGEEFVPAVTAVGGLADRAICSRRYPVEPAEAHTAWLSQRSVYRSVRSRQPYGTRARSLLVIGLCPSRPVGQAYALPMEQAQGKPLEQDLALREISR
ncbi:MAG TPA: transglutaminase-like domain-containing protein [Acidimicrobiales bacterium]|nr:transglutaminase-like domain-containing protein [Acidimicrobiales bacterium]